MSKQIDIDFDAPRFAKDSYMEVNGLKCVLNSPEAVKAQVVTETDEHGKVTTKEIAGGLPPHCPRRTFKVDEYKGCPDNWMNGSGIAGSYFVPVKEGKGMWLDFNDNGNHTHHVAIVVSVQGVNPLTGQPLVDEAIRMEQYKTKCPKHDVEFKSDRFCEQCGYKWVPQNYLCTTGQPHGMLWLDGFITEDGTVRQYILTPEDVNPEEYRGVATQIIGDKKVYAIGVAFYLSKEEKPKQEIRFLRSYNHLPVYGNAVEKKVMAPYKGVKKRSTWDNTLELYSMDSHVVGGACGGAHSCGGNEDIQVTSSHIQGDGMATIRLRDTNDFIDLEKLPVYPHDDEYSMQQFAAGEGTTTDFDSGEQFNAVVDQKKLEIGAGAKINQKIYADPNELDFWRDTPAGFIYINYVEEGAAKRIISIGKRDLTKAGEGFLAGLKVGN